MEPFETAEVRWFYPGTCPPQLRDWFESSGGTSAAEQRTDRYLALGGRSDLGVKLRGVGLLEMKMRTADHGFTTFSKSVTGRVEEWAKWSFRLADNGEGGDWLNVEKRRRVRTYIVDEFTGRVSPGEPFQRADEACHSELVDIRLEDAHYWGLGFEAVGRGHGQAPSVLAAGIAAFLSDTPLTTGEFRAPDSCSYPALLGAR